MENPTVIKGKCLCERVHYEVSSPLLGADHCHCSMCRRQHGAAFATYADVHPDHFKWTRGEEYVKVYQPASGAAWCFCSVCGSSLAGAQDGQVRTITLGTVVGDPQIQATCHIFTGSKATWYDITDDLPQYDARIRQAGLSSDQTKD